MVDAEGQTKECESEEEAYRTDQGSAVDVTEEQMMVKVEEGVDGSLEG